jgi:hypothetical protein
MALDEPLKRVPTLRGIAAVGGLLLLTLFGAATPSSPADSATPSGQVLIPNFAFDPPALPVLLRLIHASAATRKNSRYPGLRREGRGRGHRAGPIVLVDAGDFGSGLSAVACLLPTNHQTRRDSVWRPQR